LSKRDRLQGAARDAALDALPAWKLAAGRDAIRRSFIFHDFVEAWSFLSGVALVAESLNHHPDWSNSWNKVEIELTTHDAGGVTALDFELARRIDALAA
jgi:4a-hydroxytetrahydrobiopterin dehydratase